MSDAPYEDRDPVDNLQDYIADRFATSSDVDELTQANRRLEQSEADLQRQLAALERQINDLEQERQGPNPRPDIDRLIEEARLNLERMHLRQGAERAIPPGAQVDLAATPPTDEARERLTDRLDDQSGS
ncbi:hypothetical protein [Kallotenue papyrolyticum]|uniref:hypothetical protein n=1 Tax=Kallotenue papyrolyticum TaxID=1325125 RepID=UPI0004929EA1|nr:hypothetical protein [Kallotenue papyrolyticum]